MIALPGGLKNAEALSKHRILVIFLYSFKKD